MNNDIVVSIICATNNREKLEQELISFLDKQNYRKYELIVVDTIEKKFESAAAAYNYGASKANGKYFMFCHHDIIMDDKDELGNIINTIDKLGEFGVCGVAGVSYDGMIIGNIVNGTKKNKVSRKVIEKATLVQTLDEVLFVIRREDYLRCKLLEDNKTWHLYAVEYCLKMILEGKNNYVIPSNLYHASAGSSMNSSYYVELKRFLKLNKNIEVVNTTMGIWHNNWLLSFDIFKVNFMFKVLKLLKRL